MFLTFKHLAVNFILSLLLLIPIVEAQSINGTWSFVSLYGGSPYYYDMTFTENNGVITGSGGGGGWTISGTISGNQVAWTEDYVGSSYYADRVGTISGDSMSGTWENNTQSGTWTATRISGGSNDDDDEPDDGKRKTSIMIFCNRSGVNLETAKCTATVADRGAPPRITPKGTVDFEASDGLFPDAASCLIQQTPYSPGIASCEVQFTLPFDFPIGVAFPVDATYSGDADFSPSSTSHELIVSSCVGTPDKPCSGAIALGLADLPAIINNILKANAICGKIPAAKSQRKDSPDLEGLEDFEDNSCAIKATLEMDIIEELQDLSEEDIRKLADAISNKDASLDPVLAKIKKMGSLPNLELIDKLDNLLKLSKQMQKANKEFYDNKVKNHYTKLLQFENKQNPATNFRASAIKKVKIPLATKQVYIKNGKQKQVNLKLNRRARRFAKVFLRADLKTITAKIRLSYQRKGSNKARNRKSDALDIILDSEN